MAEAVERLRPGDVVMVRGGKSGGAAAVLATSQRRGGDVRLTALTADRRKLSLSPRDFRTPPRPVGHIDLPTPYAPTSHTFQRAVARALTRARLRPPGTDGGTEQEPAAAEHPVAACPDADSHLRMAERAERLRRQVDRLQGRIRGRTESLARQFDRVLRVLEAWGYVEGWALSEAGGRLARLYHESDLLVAESLGAGLLDGLDPPSVAALASVFTFEQRRPGTPAAPSFPSRNLRSRWLAVEELARELNQAEEDAALPLTRPPDPGFAAIAHAWAAGEDLDSVLADEELSGGDFVRNAKQLIDLLRQVSDVAPDQATAAAAREASQRLFRGVVAASSFVAAPSEASAPASP